MIKENIPIVSNMKVFVTRICDECGKEEQARMGVVYKGRKIRKSDTDLCRKCACSRKYKPNAWSRRERSHLWKGGRRIDKQGVRIYDGIKGKYIYEHRKVLQEYLGRELTHAETTHHINMNNSNNALCNLYLFANPSEHRRCHALMEDLAFKVFDALIWFDRKSKEYVLTKTNNEFLKIDTNKLPQGNIRIFRRRTKTRGLQEYQIVNIRRKDGTYHKRYMHDAVAELLLERKLYKNEIVHHIDGNPSNNDPNNVVVLNNIEHTTVHRMLQKLVAELYLAGKVGFKEGRYYVI